ncbi:MAG: bifunctional 4-hydroxy-2-oxoglutarate aldolase/2-dehydro-3-deoxy-phosphogluconate aldolase [Thermoguttaceae bacterium]
MSHDSLFAEVAQHGVVPVTAVESVEAALPLADALLEGGLPVAEITFRTAAAAEVIAQMTRHRPELLVGAGTVLSEENVKAATAAGARFAVAPGLNPAVVQYAAQAGLPFVPGICTPSEIEQALGLGCRIVKFFPAEPSGGVEMVKALAAPYAHTGVRFVPTGGVNTGNLERYLSVPSVAAVGGTWIVRPEDLVGSRWQTIRNRCKEAVEIVRRVREIAP